MATMFDTLAYAKRLKSAGVPEPQAEAHAEAMADMLRSTVATKQDLKELETALRAEMATLSTALRSEIKDSTKDLKIWVGSLTVIAVGTTATLIKLFSVMPVSG
jgi:hypothetical protein